jgi:maltooligosyltrehalose trehalohydrolase
LANGRTAVRVWAPRVASLGVRVAGRPDVPLVATDGVSAGGSVAGGVFVGEVDAAPGDDYELVLPDGRTLPDPQSRWQPYGLRGPSRVLDPGGFVWTDAAWSGVTLHDLVVYELHVGAFTEAGTFDGAIAELDDLTALGITAIECMPVGTFPGERGWGYDGVYTSAPHRAYGGPYGLARLVDAAHARGLAVILDVVYNHVGPGADALSALGDYFTDRHTTFWGDALDYSVEGVREWAIQNAELWIADYHVDGLRLDATHAIFDDSRPHVLAELAQRVRAINPAALVISEMEPGDLRPIEEWGHDAQWGDGLHHAAHVLLTGELEGYYERYGSVADLATELERPQRERIVVCAQNHDQVGNRALGDRLRGAKLRLAAMCAILSAGTPLLFMGEEYDESQPFQFFTDHTDPAIAEATRAGRRREFARFAAFAGDSVPDPQDVETFRRSKLDRARGDPEHRRYYGTLLRLRAELGASASDAAGRDAAGRAAAGPVVTEVDERRRVLRVRRGDVQLLMNFSEEPVEGVPAWTGAVIRGDGLAR